MVAANVSSDVRIIVERIVTKYKVSLREDGILCIHVLNNRQWVPEDFKLLFQAIGEMVEFKRVPVLLSCEKFTFPSAEASAYWGNEETACPYVSREAQVLDSLPLKILGNFYMNFRRPKRPTRYFDNKEDAINWLHNSK
ncbi:DUF7793 family protein [Aurantibacillus circumpalustris]|uniref:DUF7793 family protein n=1 Tax=Aurantibacillus circumpalustris TaxID=3036359 RepID=UPI00295B908C|nr:hypothetical protein [Aurantibacillus circumpalustris]